MLVSVSSIPDLGSVIDVTATLDVSHSYIGNLAVNSTNNATGVSIERIDTSGSHNMAGGCPLADVDATFDDEATDLTDSACNSAGAALGGTWKPIEALSAFDNANITVLCPH